MVTYLKASGLFLCWIYLSLMWIYRHGNYSLYHGACIQAYWKLSCRKHLPMLKLFGVRLLFWRSSFFLNPFKIHFLVVKGLLLSKRQIFFQVPGPINIVNSAFKALPFKICNVQSNSPITRVSNDCDTPNLIANWSLVGEELWYFPLEQF